MKYALVCLLSVLFALACSQEFEREEAEANQNLSAEEEQFGDVEAVDEVGGAVSDNEVLMEDVEQPTESEVEASGRQFTCKNCLLLVGQLRKALATKKSINKVIVEYCRHNFKFMTLYCIDKTKHRLPEIIDGIQFGKKCNVICKSLKCTN